MDTYGRRWRKVRLQVLQRDDYWCYYCGADATTVDHVKPTSKGGSMYDHNNLVAACIRCNSRKKDRGVTPGLFLHKRTPSDPFTGISPPNQTERVPSPFKQPD